MIEPLESRIAPAAVFHFTDVDGDKVTLSTTKGTAADLAGALTLSKPNPSLPFAHLDLIDFISTPELAAAFAGTSLTVSVVKSGGGDGHVDIGGINAYDNGGPNNIDLGKVIAPKAMLSFIDAGDSNSMTEAIQTLKVDSMVVALDSSTFAGPVGNLIVSHDFTTSLQVTDGATGHGDIHSLTIGGNLGRSDGIANSGSILAGRIGAATIRGDIIGGVGDASGFLFAAGGFGSLRVLGNLLGGHGGNSAGSISAIGASGTIFIGGDIQGGTLQSDEGSLNIGDYNSIHVKGSVLGGDGGGNGRILATNSSTSVNATVRIDGDIIAGTGTFECGHVFVGTTRSVLVGGNIDGGNHPVGQECGVLFGNMLGHVTVVGQLINGGSVQTTI